MFKDLPKCLRVTTDAHRSEIEILSKTGYFDSITHFGGEMYRHGMIDGAVYGLGIALIAYGVNRVAKYLKKSEQDTSKD